MLFLSLFYLFFFPCFIKAITLREDLSLQHCLAFQSEIATVSYANLLRLTQNIASSRSIQSQQIKGIQLARCQGTEWQTNGSMKPKVSFHFGLHTTSKFFSNSLLRMPIPYPSPIGEVCHLLLIITGFNKSGSMRGTLAGVSRVIEFKLILHRSTNACIRAGCY